MRKLFVAAVVACGLLLTACPEPAASCPSGSYSCGDPAGGPSCCSTGNNCCFGYDVCCKETFPHLGTRFSDGARMCYQTLGNEGVTWSLLTVCGKPAG
jgi:hypothetical protein